MNNSISYAISTCNEHEELNSLLQLIKSTFTNDDEIVIITDINSTQEVYNVVNKFVNNQNIIHFEHALNKDFANHKNFINSKCSKQYIFNIDADEYPGEALRGVNLKELLLQNPQIEMYAIPRINIVKNITFDYINLNSWKTKNPHDIHSIHDDIDDIKLYNSNNVVEPIINYPDYQARLYKNAENIKWKGKVHEQLIGYKTSSILPPYKEYSLYHIKSFDKQIKQNNFYSTI